MKRKFLMPLIFSSAMMLMWACGEGDIAYADDQDEMIKSKMEERSAYEVAEVFLEYCNSKEGKKNGCEAVWIGSCSSEDISSSSRKVRSSSSSAISSSSKPKSSSAMSSSVQIRSCSSRKSSSSSVPSSSSEAGPQVSGWCVLDAPDPVYVGDTVTWRYLPEENSIDSAKYEWKDVSKGKEVESGLVKGELSGSGAAQITVTFTSKGTKLGPELTFGDVELDCRNVVVYVQGETISSSSVVSSSSAARRSSSSRSSSSAVPEGHCAVSKSKVVVGDTVEWFVADSVGNVLSAYHNWSDLGKDGKLVSGELKGNGSSKILVTYSSPGQKSPMVQFGKQMIDCNINDDGDPFLNVDAKAVSSASEPPKESSSSAATPKSSSSKAAPKSSSSFEVIDL